ncbi:putative ankyrin repeat domain-containing protein [Helianthus annuus]|nr:putative ankyrin repeat domain-containing protein [Helianthus annuus]
MEDYSKFSHSPAHLAVAQRDHAALKKLIATLPRLAKAGAVNTEDESVAAELDADAVSAVIDRRDVPGRETPLHLAVRIKDPISADILMAAGADWSLQNENGWSALQEAEITNALEGAGAQPSEAEVAHEVALMSQTNMYRPGIDVTQAELVPHLNWRRQERSELVGPWKSKVYDMLHVMVSVKSRRVPGAMTDEELFANEHGAENGADHDEYDDVLTPEEKMQLNSALKMGNSENVCEDEDQQTHNGNTDSGSFENSESNTKDKKSWFGWNKKGSKTGGNDPEDSKILKKFSKLNETQKPSSETVTATDDNNSESKKAKDKSAKKKKKKGLATDTKHESEYKKGLRPVLWLTPDFPLKTDELVPLLDILANKVKAIRRLRELLTTKLPAGTFPVKIAIPIVPTIRVLVTFTKFEELQAASEEFSTPLSSPAHFQDSKSKEPEGSTSWISWMKGNRGDQSSDSEGRSFRDETDPFNIPTDYTWVDANEKKRRMKAKKAKIRKHKKKSAEKSAENGARQSSEDLE